MDDVDFLRGYDAKAFPPLAVTTDVVVFTIVEAELKIAPVVRREPPQKGKPALPGVFVLVDEDLDAAAHRALRQKAGFDRRVRQFCSFGAVDRDPRMRIVSVAYIALINWDALRCARPHPSTLLTVDGERVRNADKRLVTLAFDHGAIVAAAVRFLQRELDIGLWTFGLLPDEFTLRELQQVHEAVRGKALNKPAFRKRLLESRKIVATGRLETGTRFRPAELYCVNPDWDGDAR